MKLPFRQLPELPPGHALVLGAPSAAGRTFFLTKVAELALDAGLKVCYIGYQDGNAWLHELTARQDPNLTFVSLESLLFDIPTLIKLLEAGFTADVCLIDDFDRMTYQSIESRTTVSSESFMTAALQRALAVAKNKNTRIVFGVSLCRRHLEKVETPEDHDSLTGPAGIKVTPVLHPHQQPHDNLKVYRLVREWR